MILVELEPALPAVMEAAKAQVLTCLAAGHRVKVFDGKGDLEAFLDEVLDGLVAIGAPRGLTRILLFHRTPAAAEVVARRMLPGGVLRAWQQPRCWNDLAGKVPDLRAWAMRAEPGFQDPMPKGI